MKYDKKDASGRRALRSRRGWFYFGIGGRIYVFHLEMGPFGLTWEKRRKK